MTLTVYWLDCLVWMWRGRQAGEKVCPAQAGVFGNALITRLVEEAGTCHATEEE